MLATLLLAAALAPQTTVTLAATDSKSVASRNGANWNDNRLRAYWNAPGQGFVDGFAKFDLRSLPAGAEIVAATLRVYHEGGVGSPSNQPEVRIYRSANDAWSRAQVDLHPGLGAALSPVRTQFPAAALAPVDFALHAAAVPWAADLADGFLTLALRNEAGHVARKSYVYFHGSDPAPAPPELILTWRMPPVLAVTNLTAGATAVFTVTGATPGARIGIGLSVTGAGPTALNTGGCGTHLVLMRLPLIKVGIGPADPAGTASFAILVPAGASGRRIWSQGIDYGSCLLTAGVTEVIG